MHEARLMDLLAEVLSVHGYECSRQAALEGRSGTVYTVPLLAEGEEHAIVIDARLGEDPLPAQAAADVADVMHDVGADHAILCHRGAAEPTHIPGVVLWGHDALVQIIGDAQLSAAIESPLDPIRFTPVRTREAAAESLTEILPRAFSDGDLEAFESMDLGMLDAAPEASAGPAPDAFGLDGLDIAFDMDGLADIGATAAPMPEPTPGHGPTSASPVEAPTPEPVAFSHPLLPVRVTADEARMAIRRRMEAVDSTMMVLQPVHLLDYECDLLAEGSLRYDTIQGRVQIHGTEKTVVEVDPEAVDPQGFTRLGEGPRLPGNERTLRVTDGRARDHATNFLLEAHTRLVDIEVDEPDLGFSYTEKKKVAPRPDHIRLNPLGVFMRIRWRFIGPAGHIDVDALDGHIVEEVLQNPHSDAMIID